MKTKFTFILALLAFQLSLSFGQTSAVPGTISYQGRVYNPDGTLLGAGTPVNRTVIFRIWDSPSATTQANLLYSESQTVTISEGEFSVLVGNGIANTTQTYSYSETSKHSSASPAVNLANVFNGATRYLSVTVANASTISVSDSEISPRQQIVSSAFAFRSKFAEVLGTSASGNSLQVLDNGNVGVGNASPPSALTVTGASSSTASPQLLLTATDTTERLRLGVNDTGNGTGFIQAWKEGSGSQNLTLNSDGGNVGIGNSAPTNQLSVTGAADFSGDVGIGVTSPLAKLHVNGTAQFRSGTASHGFIQMGPGNNTRAGLLGWYKPGGDRLGYMGYDTTDVLLKLENSADFKVTGGEVGIGMDPTNPLSVSGSADFSGNVGIGKTNPTAKLDVVGNLRLTSNSNPHIHLGGDVYLAAPTANGDFSASALAGDAVLRSNSGNLRLQSGIGAAGLTVSSSNKVGIGVPSPLAKLHVGATAHFRPAAASHGYLAITPGSGSNAGYLGWHKPGGTRLGYMGYDPTDVLLNLENGSDFIVKNGSIGVGTTDTSQGNVSVAGHFTSVGSHNNAAGYLKMYYYSGAAYFEVKNSRIRGGVNDWRGWSYDGDNNLDWRSDRRLKTDIIEAEPMLDRLLQLPFHRYRWKGSAEVGAAGGNDKEFGVIAQEVEPLFPDLIGKDKDGFMTVGYTTFATIACKSIQELNKKMEDKIAQLETKLSEKDKETAALEARLSALEKLVNSSQ